MPTKYSYRPLPSGTQTIRLLQLQPAASDADPLRASLVDAFIGHPAQPAYEAISYVWGDPVFPETLHLDASHGGSEAHAITVNLAQCLVSLRSPYTTRVLWADAVCINQEDLEEKGSQISLMGSIYQTATRVLIRLGEPPPGESPLLPDPGLFRQLQSGTAD